MTDKKPLKIGPIAARARETAQRLGLTDSQAADYFGVPVFTYRKWATGEREPSAAVLRLLEVLGIVEALAPSLHGSFLTPENGHVKKLSSTESTAS